jgi:X-Pro dipeptidyl-peptidase
MFSFADAIRETVWVETGSHTDADGRFDRVAADIIRPSEAARLGVKVPVIMEVSPYYSCCGRGNEAEFKTYDAQGRPVGFPLFYDNWFVPRGYAVVLVDLAGTNRSQGCVDIGGPSDVASASRVIDWLNGRANGYDRDGASAVSASWTNGNVGMIGKSYDGTIANAVAATGVEGLRTIVPISAVSSWYDYFRSDGASFGFDPVGLARRYEENGGRPECEPVKRELVAGAPGNGDVTPFWRERDYTLSASKVTASVFAVHALGDLNVKTIHFGQWWDALSATGAFRKVWLSQAGHIDPFDFRREEWVRTLTRWFDHWLLGVDNGIDREPVASIERAPDRWVDDPTWPPADASVTTWYACPGDTDGVGRLAPDAPDPTATAEFTDDPAQNEFEWALHSDRASPARVLYATGPLVEDLRLAGSGSVTVTATPSTSEARISAVLVDYGPATIRDNLSHGAGVHDLATRSCWGASRPGDSACYLDTETTISDVDHEVFARGWADLGHFAALEHGEPLRPGSAYPMTFRLSTVDHVVPPGHRLAVIIAGTDGAFVTPPDQPPTIILNLSGTAVRLPVV